jgi:hypothetical protein
MPVPANPQQRKAPAGGLQGITWDVATSLPAERIEQARDLIADYLAILHRPSPCREIIAAVVGELDAARRWRIDNMAAEDEAIRLREVAQTHAEDVANAVETVGVLARYAGRRWRLSFPDTARRLASLVWLDILTADALGDREALARALNRHYPERAA